MRIAHILRFYQEGLGYEENHLGRFQALDGVEVTLIASVLPSGSWQETSDATLSEVDDTFEPYEDRGLRIHRLNPSFRARANSQVVLRGLKNTLRLIQPDILHIHGPVGLLCIQSLLAARSLDIPSRSR